MLRSILASFLCFLTAATRADQPPVQLITSDPLAPTSTLEIRFATDLAKPEQLGKSAEPAPIQLHPEVAGEFTWVSARSGIFKPAEPYPLGTTIMVSLRPELAAVKSGALPADWKTFVNPPPFALKASSPVGYLNSGDASAEPTFVLLFNDNVSPEKVAEHIWFTRSGGENSPGVVSCTWKISPPAGSPLK